MIGLPADELAHLLGISEIALARWIIGTLSTDQSDVVEVGLALLEMHHAQMRHAPTLRLTVIAAA